VDNHQRPFPPELWRQRSVCGFGSRKTFSRRKGRTKIAVEVKSFVGASEMDDLEKALGQFVLYRAILAEREPQRQLYIAAPNEMIELFEQPLGQLLFENELVRVLLFNAETEAIVKWIG
jgi:hypothetical protein